MPSVPSDPGMPALVPGWSPSESLAALQRLMDVATTAPVEVARRAGLSASELHSLRHLASGAMGPGELARALGITSAASSGVVDRLVAHGLVQRRPHPDDGRRTEVHITPTGRMEMVRHLEPMFRALGALDAALDPTERAAVTRYLLGAAAAVRTLL